MLPNSMSLPQPFAEQRMDALNDRQVIVSTIEVAIGQKLIGTQCRDDGSILTMRRHIMVGAGPQLPIGEQARGRSLSQRVWR